jgi:hypothetical protein
MPVRDFGAFRKSAIRYWERRRLLYNLVLVPPSFFVYTVSITLFAAGDVEPHLAYAFGMFGFAALCANICYSFAYAMEFFFGDENPNSKWLSSGRTTTFVLGILLSIVLAVMTAYNIAALEWDRGYYRHQ